MWRRLSLHPYIPTLYLVPRYNDPFFPIKLNLYGAVRIDFGLDIIVDRLLPDQTPRGV
jgi:hypothetical protein